MRGFLSITPRKTCRSTSHFPGAQHQQHNITLHMALAAQEHEGSHGDGFYKGQEWREAVKDC